MSCSNCNTDLAGLEYVEEDNKDLCIGCHDLLFGKLCNACRKLIPLGTKFSTHEGKYWHKDCFQCIGCKTALTKFKIGDDKQFYCHTCHTNKYSLKCIVCRQAITTSLKYVENDGRLFHEDCFRCSSKTCGKKLDNGYIPKDDEVFCQECYREIISTRTFKEMLPYPDPILSELFDEEQTIIESTAQSFKTQLTTTIKLSHKKILIPKVRDKNLLIFNTERTQTVSHLFPTILMNTSVQNGSIQLRIDDLAKQDVDVIVVCSTSKIILQTILQQAGLVVSHEYNRLSATVNQQTSIIETGPGNLNCKAILFLPWIPPTNGNATTFHNSISEFVSKLLHHILYHSTIYRTVAFPAIECSLGQCSMDIVAKAMIDAAVAKLTETMLYFTVSFVVSPNECNTHQKFAEKLVSIQKPAEPFGYIEYSFSKLTLTLIAKQEANVKTCRSTIETHLNTCTQVKSRDNEENLNIWTQQLVLHFYKYCLDHHIWPTIDFEHRKITLKGRKEAIDEADKHFLELTTKALKQAHLNSILRNIVWEYQINSTTWLSYSYQSNAEIEYAFHIKQLQTMEIINEQSEKCQIDFKKNIELFKQRSRNIRRRQLISVSLPIQWQCQSENYCRFVLDECTDEYRNIKQLFDQTMSNLYTCIKSIERIQNQRWYKQYAAHREAMNDRLKHETEKQLFHGCGELAANNIVEECFNRSYAGVNGTVYGQGVYFATNAKYSHAFAHPNQAGERCMFLVLVLIGKSIGGHRLMKMPPTGYDSTTDNNQIFVVYHDAQAYADYLIKYQ